MSKSESNPPSPLPQASTGFSSVPSPRNHESLGALSQSFQALLPPLEEILRHMKEQVQATHSLATAQKAANRWMQVTVCLAAITLVLCLLMGIRAHITTQRIEQTEVRLIELGKLQQTDINVTRQAKAIAEASLRAVSDARKAEDEKPTITLVPDKKKPSSVKVVIVPPKHPAIVKVAPIVEDAGAPSAPTGATQLKLPENVTVGP